MLLKWDCYGQVDLQEWMSFSNASQCNKIPKLQMNSEYSQISPEIQLYKLKDKIETKQVG